MASSTEKHENGKKAHSMTWIMARNTEKRGKWEMHTVGPAIWWKNWKNEENEKHTI